MRQRYGSVGWRAIAALMVGCSAAESEQPQLAEQSQAIVYGKDDRLDWYQHPDAQLRALAQSSVLALVPKTRVVRPATGEVRLSAPTLESAYELCADERFIEQVVASDCTGVLIDRDLVLTAGHCFEERECQCFGKERCQEFAYVFDYFLRAEGQLESISASDVYSCRKMVAKEMLLLRSGTRIDYAVVQLDRPVVGREPVRLREQPLQPGEPLAVVGTGSGLPLKLDSAASVLESRDEAGDYFTLEADTFEGSSGSGVFDATGALTGVLVRGGTDYEQDEEARCNRVRIREKATVGELGPGELGQEQATHIRRALSGLCDAGFPSERLCASEAECGDGYCTADETRQNCPDDCQLCTSESCESASDPAAHSGNKVEQRATEWKSREAGCSAAPHGRGSFSWMGALSALVALLALRHRRRTA